jgi:hypothetical protein
MMWMSKRLLILASLNLLLVFLLSSSVFSSISITNLELTYNLGENIEPIVTITGVSDFNGFVRVSLNCDSYDLLYYVRSFNIKEGDKETLDIPSLISFNKMKGNCVILAELYDLENLQHSYSYSNYFKVTDSLIVKIDNYISIKNPGDDILISGILLDSNQKPVSGKVSVKLGNYSVNYDIESDFRFYLSIPSSIKPGANVILLDFIDKNNNIVDEIMVINITQLPSSVRLRLSSSNVKPGDNLIVTAYILDQINGVVPNSRVNITFYNNSQSIINQEINQGDFVIPINNSLLSGEYFISASYSNLTSNLTLNILSFESIIGFIQDGVLYFNNNGNIGYVGPITLFLSGTDGDIFIEENISLKPGENISLTLSGVVNSGNYNILFENETLGDLFVPKSLGAFGITGRAMADLAVKPSLWFSLLLIIIIILIILFIWKKFKDIPDLNEDPLKDIKHKESVIYPNNKPVKDKKINDTQEL